MKLLERLRDRGRGLTNTVVRYPLTMVFLVAAAILIAVQINGNHDEELTKYLLTCTVGAVLGAALQALYERYFVKIESRLGLYGIGVLLTAGYYLIIRNVPEFGTEIGVRTSVALFALMIAFIWVPVIRSEVTFNESFMALFKSLFLSAFYSAVIMGGTSAILAAIDTLIVRLNSDMYSYAADVIFVLFAPVYFLSLIPVYPGKRDLGREGADAAKQKEAIEKAAFCPKFLEVLISYIIIPLTAVFTLILVIYIVMNIRGEFWTNNLLEPMLIAYAITVILVYILASRLENKFAVLFRRIFPKVLIPIVLFQIASSLLSVRDLGITHIRYFVILFGIFAALAGLVMSVLPVRKNGLIAVLLIMFSAISILPPVDAFTVSRVSQTHILESVLLENGMLKDNAVIQNESISKEDKEKITSAASYLSRMEYTDRISWLPAGFEYYSDFYSTFGFREAEYPSVSVRSVNVYFDPAVPVGITGYDFLAKTYVNRDEQDQTIGSIETSGVNYTVYKEGTGDYTDLVLKDDTGRELLRFDTEEIFERYLGYDGSKYSLTKEEATFTAESDTARAKILVQNANMNLGTGDQYFNAEIIILMGIK